MFNRSLQFPFADMRASTGRRFAACEAELGGGIEVTGSASLPDEMPGNGIPSPGR
jgi:hypothetical protein